MKVLKHLPILSVVLVSLAIMSAQAVQPGSLDVGQSLSLDIPDNLKIAGAREGYFYTHGPVLVSAYDFPCTVVIRDVGTGALVADDAIYAGNPVYETTLPAGFYYINLGADAGVLAGASSSRKCNGYYHYRFNGEPYGDLSEADKFYLRATNGCDNLCYIFSPNGASTGRTCCDTIWLEPSCGETFSLDASTDFHAFDPGDLTGILQVDTGGDVMVLARDDSGYFVPPHTSATSGSSYYYTYQGADDDLNIHSFADGTEVSVLSLQTSPPLSIWSGTLNEGETHTVAGSFSPLNRVVRVSTTKGQTSVSVLGGSDADNTNYMTYALDPNGHMQGTDFITKSHTGGFIYVTGLEEGTHIEVRNAATEGLIANYLVDKASVMNVNPGLGTWRIRADKDVTVCVGKGYGASFIPLTENATGSTPFPPVIVGVNWTPMYPRTSDSNLIVRWLTDENCTSELSYRIGSGIWQEATTPLGYRSEHQISINLSSITTETSISFHVHATDQSGSTTTDDNGGANYQVTVREDAPDLSVTLNSMTDHGTYFSLQFYVVNNGAGSANNGMLHCRLYGMQPMSDGVDSSYTNVTSDRIDPSIPIPDMGPGDVHYLNLNVVPYLSQSGSIDYRMNTCTTDTEDDWGHNIHQSHAVAYDWDNEDIESPLFYTNYVVLANLSRFYSINAPSGASAQQMPRSMAQFSSNREATLVYMTTGDPETIRDFIQGRFNGKVEDGWRDGGYLLLVGCSMAIPAFGWHLDCTFYDSFDLWMSDNTYANLDEDGHYTPELCIGRMTGDTPDTFVSLFTRAQTTHSYDKALSISGTGDGEGCFADNAEECSVRLDARYTDSPYFRLNDYADTDRLEVYQDNTNNTDFLYYRDHGSVDGIDSLGVSDVAGLNFGGKFPIVYSNACLTGQVQTNGNLAHEFLSRCASVFIGATQVSPRSENNSLGNKITARHRDGYTIGEAFRNAKRDLAGDIHWYTLCIDDMQIKKEILMYNLYGDPMRGGTPKSHTKEKAVYDTPQKEFAIEIPMFETEKGLDGYDHVTIPDEEHGDLLLVLNEPIMPIYRWKALYAPGVRVNKISMALRDGKSTVNGLNLPLAWGNETETPGPGDVPSPGVFPSDAFHWTRIERPNGALEVVLTVHPFLYNYDTKEATYYRNYSFNMDSASSKVSILGITPAYESMSLQKGQEFNVDVYNGESTSQILDLMIEITDMGSNDTVEILKKNAFEVGINKTERENLVWFPASLPPTGYLATATLTDADSGDERDVAYAQFRMGTLAVTVQSFEMDSHAPGYVKRNEDVGLSMEVKNTGDIPNSVTCCLQIKRVSDNQIIQEWTCYKESLADGNSMQCSQVWNTGDLAAGEYQFVGWCIHRGGTTEPKVISFERVKPMRMGWSLPQDVYMRGDKIMGTCNLYREDGSVIGLGDNAGVAIMRPSLTFFYPTLDTHWFSPHYSTSFVMNSAEARGVYGIVSTASKTGYQNALGGRWFVVDDEGFNMLATPAVAIADGISTIAVSSDVVQENGVTIPEGTFMTLLNWTGVITTPDADAGTDGLQIASSGGRFNFTWRSSPNTSLDAFVFGTLGATHPKSGVSARFKGVDFNENKWVDVHDIVFVQASDGADRGTPEYDFRKDLDENGIINASDKQAVLDRWGMIPAGDIVSDTISQSVGSTGIILRLNPAYAVLQPGQNLSVELIGEGLDNLGGFEFVAAMMGGACSQTTPPAVTPFLGSTGNAMNLLGPTGYQSGYRTGAFATGQNVGPGGMGVLGTITIHANSSGQSNLILSSVVFSGMNGKGIPIKQAQPGLYIVGDEAPTPTPTRTMTKTPVSTPTPTRTPTQVYTPTATPTLSVGDTNGDGEVNMNDVFFFTRAWKSVSSEAEGNCNPVEDDVVDTRDLLMLLAEWGK